MKRHAAAALTATLALAGGAHAQTNQELKATLEQAMKTIADLQQRVKVLEEQKAAKPAAAAAPAATAATTPASAGTSGAAPTASAAAPAPAGAPVIAVGSVAQEGAKEPEKARVEFYGHVMLDAIYDGKQMNPDWSATMRPSQIPIICPGSPGCGRDGATVFSVRQSSLGFKSFIPTSLGEIKTDMSFDLFGTNGGTQVHWLNAWAELGMVGAGQTYTNFMDIDVFPNTIDYWGPSGMVFVRNPQLRVTPWSKDGATVSVSLEAPNSAIDTGKISRVDPALGSGISGWNRLPDLVGAARLDRDWGHVRAAAIARQVGYQNTAAANGEPSGSRTGYGLNLSGAIKVLGNDKISWQVASGKGIASYMNDGGVDLAPDAALKAEAVTSLGWLVYYGHAWNDKWTSSIGYSEHRQTNTDGQIFTAFHKGSYSSVNLLYALAGNVMVGGELIWGRLENKLGMTADDYRFQFSTKVSF